MAEYCGAYTLVENTNMRDFATLAFPQALSKIAFHTGMISSQLFNLLAKTLCQLIVMKEESGKFSWMLVFDQEPMKATKEDVEAIEDNGMNFKMKARIGEDFIFVVPITGEKAKSIIKRKSGNPNALEQTIHFQSGQVEVTFIRADSEVRLQFLHKPSGTTGSQVYKKNASFEVLKDSHPQENVEEDEEE